MSLGQSPTTVTVPPCATVLGVSLAPTPGLAVAGPAKPTSAVPRTAQPVRVSEVRIRDLSSKAWVVPGHHVVRAEWTRGPWRPDCIDIFRVIGNQRAGRGVCTVCPSTNPAAHG